MRLCVTVARPAVAIRWGEEGVTALATVELDPGPPLPEASGDVVPEGADGSGVGSALPVLEGTDVVGAEGVFSPPGAPEVGACTELVGSSAVSG
jgi:hypothetical protein